MKIKLKPLDWFKQNAFKDKDGDFWATAESRNSYNNGNGKVSNLLIKHTYVTKRIINAPFLSVDAEVYENIAWAVATIITKREYPEYFI